MTDAKHEWYLSLDGEYFGVGSYGSRDAAINDGIRMFQSIDSGQEEFNELYPDGSLEWPYYGPGFFVGKRMDWWPAVDEDYMLDSVIEQAGDYAGEFAEGWLDVPKEQRELLRGMLQKTFDKWIEETGNQPTFFMIEQSEIIDPRDFEIANASHAGGDAA